MPRRWKYFAVLVPLVIVLDHLSKWWARTSLPHDGTAVSVIDGYWDWVLAYNTGSAFSMFAGGEYSRILLSVVALIAIAAITWMVHQADDRQVGLVIALSLMSGGALGNLIDRIAMGKVTDFVLWRYQDLRWPVFNIADTALSVAVGLFVLVSIRDARRERASRALSA